MAIFGSRTRALGSTLLILVEMQGCAGDPEPSDDEGLAGAGGTEATGGDAPGGSSQTGDGGSTTGGLGGVGGGNDFPDDAFVTVWDTAFGYYANDVVELHLAFDGTYDFTVDWGDGSASEVTAWNDPDAQHVYGDVGTYVVAMRGHFEGWYLRRTCVEEDEYEDCVAWASDGDLLLEIQQWGSFRFAKPDAFRYSSNLTISATDIPDLSPPVNLQGAFADCPELLTIPSIDRWDVSQVTNLSRMFFGSPQFNADLSSWDTSQVEHMTSTFAGAHSFDSDLSAWDTSSLRSMDYTFASTEGFRSDLSGWDTSSVVSMSGTFAHARALDVDISGWDTSSVVDMSGLFSDTVGFDGDLSGWDTSSVTDMGSMLSHTVGFDSDISGWDTSSVEYMASMFEGANGFERDISGWDTSSVHDMSNMFSEAVGFDQNLSAWDIEALQAAEEMFLGSGLSSDNYDALLISWAAQPTQTDVPFSAGDTPYTNAAADARAVLVEERGWTITDGGLTP